MERDIEAGCFDASLTVSIPLPGIIKWKDRVSRRIWQRNRVSIPLPGIIKWKESSAIALWSDIKVSIPLPGIIKWKV